MCSCEAAPGAGLRSRRKATIARFAAPMSPAAADGARRSVAPGRRSGAAVPAEPGRDARAVASAGIRFVRCSGDGGCGTRCACAVCSGISENAGWVERLCTGAAGGEVRVPMALVSG